MEVLVFIKDINNSRLNISNEFIYYMILSQEQQFRIICCLAQVRTEILKLECSILITIRVVA